MRLLNTTTFELKDFLGDHTPEYAILSHTWGDEEIIFQDLSAQARAPDEPWKTKKSFKKVSGFCSLAHENGYQWCWIDTCCIDKTSSAELSEAINSMFRWYAQSHVCFVYLADVRVDHTHPEKLKGFEESRWHKRGWTLQELLAPERVEFYDLDWNLAGTKYSLRGRLSKITRIRAEILTAKFDVEASQDMYCVAEKMSWAADRKTSRVEDLAYCLLGIFDVNMPLLYGEGSRAFERLQFQILAETEDLTLFAWQGPSNLTQSWYGAYIPAYPANHLLAKSPTDFYEFNKKYSYESLEAGSYNKVWEHLDSIRKETDSTAQKTFVPDQPTKRLGTITLSIALLPNSKNEYDALDAPVSLILCRIRRPKGSKHEYNRQYLCLPVHSRGTSILCTKNSLPEPKFLASPGHLPEIHFRRISIRLKPESKRVLSYEPWTWLVPTRPSAFVISLQGQGSSSKQFVLSDFWDPSVAVLLRHGATEFIILCGWHEAGNKSNPRALPWAMITNWEDLHSARDLVPTESKRRNPGDFAQFRLSSGAQMYCKIKPLFQEWCLSHRNTISESQFQVLVDRPRILLILDVLVKSSKGELERIGYLGSRVFSDYARLGDWIDESNPSPRDVLLANPQWQREN